ncbi:HlyD family efflux transporter periplasmic adaptor subunit [Mucilaginibacter auburnensis]|uniref:HlyD family secretion protein n=1 Tax=Mucilaginibacter auburnensis TaxID=1457233 RepID=A0A2H9VUH1_9SPHI|nr:HlyD family secretion protein [Mucilaginibacter auburnensis]PJJ84442.1 HlyD family secretion protein [Mucilaginibacter auburnensis]
MIIIESSSKDLNVVRKPDFSKINSDKHSEEIQEIITKVPNWIIRWGITLLFIIVLVAISISVIVRYPDTVKVKLKIEAANTVKSVIAGEAGYISRVFITTEQIISKGQVLAEIYSETSGKHKFLLAPYSGRVASVAIIQKGYFLKANQEVFRIMPNNEFLFGVVKVSGDQINKVKIGQDVVMKLNNYPFEEYGVFKGKISYVADEPSNEGFFAVQVAFEERGNLKDPRKLKTWMTGSAEIITKDITLLRRFYNLMVKELK